MSLFQAVDREELARDLLNYSTHWAGLDGAMAPLTPEQAQAAVDTVLSMVDVHAMLDASAAAEETR